MDSKKLLAQRSNKERYHSVNGVKFIFSYQAIVSREEKINLAPSLYKMMKKNC